MNIKDFGLVEYDNCFIPYVVDLLEKSRKLYVPISDDILRVSIETGKPIITFGLPKNIRKYIEKNSYTLSVRKTKAPKITTLVQTPLSGGIIDFSFRKENPKDWLKEGILVTTLEESKILTNFWKIDYFLGETDFDEDILSFIRS